MTLSEQIKVVNKYVSFVEKNKKAWVDSGRVKELDVNYDIECLKYASNSLTELLEFQRNIIARKDKK